MTEKPISLIQIDVKPLLDAFMELRSFELRDHWPEADLINFFGGIAGNAGKIIVFFKKMDQNHHSLYNLTAFKGIARLLFPGTVNGMESGRSLHKYDCFIFFATDWCSQNDTPYHQANGFNVFIRKPMNGKGNLFSDKMLLECSF